MEGVKVSWDDYSIPNIYGKSKKIMLVVLTILKTTSQWEG